MKQIHTILSNKFSYYFETNTLDTNELNFFWKYIHIEAMLPFPCKLPSNSFALLLSLETTLLLWQNKGKWHQSLNIFWQSKSWKRQGAAKSREESFSKSNNKRTFPCSADQSTANNFANQKLIFQEIQNSCLDSTIAPQMKKELLFPSGFLLDLNTY